MAAETAAAAICFAVPSRILHRLMAPMVIAGLFIGVTMIASLAYYPLLAIHRPPPLPPTMSAAERRVASWSESLLYGLLLAQPMSGRAAPSAARLPITPCLCGVVPHAGAARPHPRPHGVVARQTGSATGPPPRPGI
ncbi:cytochrome b561 family protein [Mycobacterium bohemicum DSM 44277]|uniref:Uncharacterized protein n=2 Tax=Mycobacterium bohemicum TaxID=56425 RepID=A0A1X1RB57_MYCBE|nr:hypothetical protein AWB93_05480 [Mycobacterium bohemicum]CPR12866.1 cytochrome b561 family protein [Mycobacterium bohemicum DSM 44277]